MGGGGGGGLVVTQKEAVDGRSGFAAALSRGGDGAGVTALASRRLWRALVLFGWGLLSASMVVRGDALMLLVRFFMATRIPSAKEARTK